MPGTSTSPSLTERRKAETRLEIARTAAALFIEHGLRATRAEDVAREAGVAPRTFYRYFATKEEAVAPVFSVGVRRWVDAVRDAPYGLTVPEALTHAARAALSADDEENARAMGCVRQLLRQAEEAPALRSVWNDAHYESEVALAGVLAERTGHDPEGLPLRLAAGTANTAVRIAVESWAAAPDAPADGPEGPAALVARTIESLSTPPWSLI
ncbi:TetR family transcriptional regulator [Streptomyces sp. ODS28]|uniref:TetR/AcrR family transcriptional regulator n=1 Tax=Streptomyces sp. ODS28 TaxID=3136688 RepID=UPI0031F0B2DB